MRNETYYKSGVYAITAVERNEIYIGSTNCFKNRKNNHFSCWRKQNIKKGIARFQEVFDNKELLQFEILEVCENYLEREQYWINFYKNHPTLFLINQFDADRNNSNISKDFRLKMSKIIKENWAKGSYKNLSEESKKTQFTSESLSKLVHHFDIDGNYIDSYKSAKTASEILNLSTTTLASIARGKYCKGFKYKNNLFIYDVVLDKLDELLETHQELRAISSQAWESCKNTKKVQRLIGEQGSNNPNTSVQQSKL